MFSKSLEYSSSAGVEVTEFKIKAFVSILWKSIVTVLQSKGPSQAQQFTYNPSNLL